MTRAMWAMRLWAGLLVGTGLVVGAGCGSTDSEGSESGGSGGRGTGGAATGGSAGAAVVEPRRPFGATSVQYVAGVAEPSGELEELAAATAEFYDEWKERYVVAGCGEGRYYVATEFKEGNLTLSEGVGYGMIAAAYFAGHDRQAKAIFDGLYRLFRDHPAASSDDLMAWYLDEDCEAEVGGERDETSASDGDLDIAYALLLADAQWGSCGEIDYRTEAERVIAAIAEHELDPTQRFVQPGDWPSDDVWSRVMRSSDFMPGHFAAFGAAMGEAWASGGAGGTDGEGAAGAEGAGGAGGASSGGTAGAATGGGPSRGGEAGAAMGGGASRGGEAGAATGGPSRGGEAGAGSSTAGAVTGGAAGANAGSVGVAGAGGTASASGGQASGGSAGGGTATGGTLIGAGGTWGTLMDSGYASFAQLQANHASETGLVPDYILDPVDAPAPAVDLPRDEETEPWDEHYAWNACRVPWRVGVHYLITGDVRARDLLEPINVWAEAATEGEPLAFAAGYALDGTRLPGQQFPSMAFIAPLGVSAMIGADQQEWLDAIWSAVVAAEPEDYYSDSVKLLCMIAMSRGWWVPEAVGEECE